MATSVRNDVSSGKLARQVFQKLLADKIVCVPMLDDVPRCELRAKFTYDPVFSGLIGLTNGIGSGTRIRTPVSWLRTTCPDP
jgi:hypothetical protein